MSFNAGAKTSLLQYPANNRICGDSTRRRMMSRSGLKPVAGKFSMESSRSMPTALQTQRPLTMPPMISSIPESTTKAASFGPPAKAPRAQEPHQYGESSRPMHSQQQPSQQQPPSKHNSAPSSVPRQNSAPNLSDSRAVQQNHQSSNQQQTNSSFTRQSPPQVVNTPSVRQAPEPVVPPPKVEPAPVQPRKYSSYDFDDIDDIDDGGDSPLHTDTSSIYEWHDSISDSIVSSDGNGIRERAKLIRSLSKNLAMAQQEVMPTPLPVHRTNNDMIPLLATRLSTPDDEYGSDEEEF